MIPASTAAPPRHPFILMNPRSGGGKVQRYQLREKAERLGATVALLAGHEVDMAAMVHRAVDAGADLVGIAGGDGSQAAVAGVAADRGVPLLVIPAGTRNHFAMDLGLDRSDPSRALDGLRDGVEVVVDLGEANDHPFVNNVSFGAYAEIVDRPDYRDSKLRVALQALPDVLSGREQQRFSVRAGTVTVTDPAAALVSNNPYGTGNIAGIARRPRLDTGTLGLICFPRPPAEDPATVLRERRLQPPAVVTTSTKVVVEAEGDDILAAIDGESVLLASPVTCGLRAHVLRVRVPRARSRGPRRGG